MAYAAFSVVFGEQPSAAKWNILGSNDASFNDGTGIANMATSTTSISNPYKFKAYRNAAYTPTDSTTTKYPFDAEDFDTNSNYDATTNYRYTCPVSGFYYFGAHLRGGTSSTRVLGMLYKNGAEIVRFFDIVTGAAQSNGSGSTIVQATAGNYFEFYYYIVTPSAASVGSSLQQSFEGFLVSQT